MTLLSWSKATVSWPVPAPLSAAPTTVWTLDLRVRLFIFRGPATVVMGRTSTTHIGPATHHCRPDLITTQHCSVLPAVVLVRPEPATGLTSGLVGTNGISLPHYSTSLSLISFRCISYCPRPSRASHRTNVRASGGQRDLAATLLHIALADLIPLHQLLSSSVPSQPQD